MKAINPPGAPWRCCLCLFCRNIRSIPPLIETLCFTRFCRAYQASFKTNFRKLVPPGYRIRIEFEPEDLVFQATECIDLMIMQNPQGFFVQDWKLPWHSEKLDSMLRLVNWNYNILTSIRNLLLAAHCISIENDDEVTTIGYARSGMGMYSYKLFDNNLSPKQIQQYNNGSTYIFYKRNIVLNYDGGAIGPQSFPD